MTRLTEKTIAKESYNIDVDYNSKLADDYDFSNSADNIESVVAKLGKLEDIEEEYGISLIVLFKALSCGAWEKRKDNMLNFDDCKLLYKRIQIGSNVHWLSNYGKTWALTREELEK